MILVTIYAEVNLCIMCVVSKTLTFHFALCHTQRWRFSRNLPAKLRP